jgi:hypothetical protein
MSSTGPDQHRKPGKTRRKAAVSAGERAVGYAVLATLFAISIFVFSEQFRFNPAVEVALRQELPAVLPQGDAGLPKSGVAALIPEDLPGFTPLSNIETFGSEDLSDKINGKAELYLSSGFKEMACRSYAVGAVLAPELSNGPGSTPDPGSAPGADSSPGSVSRPRVEILVYEMTTPRGAYAVFSGQRRAGSEPSALAPKAYFTENGLFFASGSYYVEIIADQASELVRKSLEEAGSKLLAGLPSGSDSLEETALFPREGLMRESIRLTATDAFGLDGFTDVFTAEYRLESDEATVFVSMRQGREDAAAWATKYADFLRQNGYRDVTADDAPPGSIVLSLDNIYEVVMTRDAVLAGVHDAMSLPIALELARGLAAEMEGKQK